MQFLSAFPPPKVDMDAPLQMLVTNIAYDEYKGTTAIGRVHSGKIQGGQPLARMMADGQIVPERARYLFIQQGLERVEVNSAEAGEIVIDCRAGSDCNW